MRMEWTVFVAKKDFPFFDLYFLFLVILIVFHRTAHIRSSENAQGDPVYAIGGVSWRDVCFSSKNVQQMYCLHVDCNSIEIPNDSSQASIILAGVKECEAMQPTIYNMDIMFIIYTPKTLENHRTIVHSIDFSHTLCSL